jgi:hypothetical protein
MICDIAAHILGRMYQEGLGTNIDTNKSNRIFIETATRNYAAANIGLILP